MFLFGCAESTRRHGEEEEKEEVEVLWNENNIFKCVGGWCVCVFVCVFGCCPHPSYFI